jgi:hypothetical protein
MTGFASFLAFRFVLPFAVDPAGENMDDGKEIVGKLCVIGVNVFIENHEFGVVSFQDPLEEVVGETAESVPVCNGNLADHSLESEFQNGLKAFSSEVEA